jgi:hypothetical protein
MDPTVTFETKCWEGDWRRLLQTDRLRQMADLNDFPFVEKILMINNVKNYQEVARYADKAVQSGCLTKYYRVEDYADEVLIFFGLSRELLGRGYVYSISELASIYLCRSDFLLHFAGDCIPAQHHAWIPKAIELFGNDSRIKVANLLWNHNLPEAESESIEQTADFFKSIAFSDQNYLIRVSDFRQRIYGYSHPNSARYPDYGGELYEKRVDSWLQCQGHLRATYKHASYLHQNNPPTTKQRIKAFAWRVKRGIIWRLNRLKAKTQAEHS